jgi:hypothetical protein
MLLFASSYLSLSLEFLVALQLYVDLNEEGNYLQSAGAAALVSSKAGRAAKVRIRF